MDENANQNSPAKTADELRDCYCTTALQTKWGCFRRVAALPLLPAVGVTVLAPYPT
jgi:hypothetical protein